FLDDFEGAAQALFGAARQQEGPNRIDGHALPANDLAHILRIKAQFINRSPLTFHWRHGDSLRVLHQPFNDIFEERLHCRRSGYAATAGAAALLAFLIKLATVSLGCAPLLSQYLARSRFRVKLSPFLRG